MSGKIQDKWNQYSDIIRIGVSPYVGAREKGTIILKR
tara:strand:+ start:456 stop:566 length:111 start_codon:yes stop_codon:yes gene_type:complete